MASDLENDDRAVDAGEDLGTVDQVVASARQALQRAQRFDGAWSVGCHSGPAATAHVTVALHFIGKLSDEEAGATARWLEGQWLGDGRGFESYPGAGFGDLGATAVVLAALHACGVDRDHPVVRDSQDFVARNGGEEGLLQRYRQGDLAALFLAMVGRFPVQRLPAVPPALFVPGVERTFESRLSVILPFTFLATHAIVRFLRARHSPAKASPRPWEKHLTELAGRMESFRTRAHFRRFHNADGSWLYGDTYHASLVLAALFAMGVPDDDPELVAGLDFLSERRRVDHPTLTGPALPGTTRCYPIFDSDVWPTAFALRALLASGTSPGEPVAVRAVNWLCACQRGGAWAFQQRNTSMPDCDDGGVTIAALAMAIDPARQPPLPPPTLARARTAVNDGRRWLFQRQNPDGGWASFQVGLPGKGRGPIMTAALAPAGDDLWSQLSLLRAAPPALGDPATEDVTGRVLYGLGRSGSTVAESSIAQAVAFLQQLQDVNGGWWGRWTINYLAATAWVLRGLVAVGVDRDEGWVQRGLSFLTDHQNPDGGWGETAASYSDLAQIAHGPSTSGLTGLVLSALLEMGIRADHPAVYGAQRYLLATQAGGTWPRQGELHALLPPRLFYELPQTENQMPLEALGLLAGRATPRSPGVRPGPRSGRSDAELWSPGRMNLMRTRTDPVADAVAAELIQRGQLRTTNGLLRMLVHPGDPLPAELPDIARIYFQSQAQLPGWAQPLKLELAQSLFERCSFAVAIALFCSSLPQCFAFPDGARTLTAGSRFPDSARRRVLETAQFVFDVAATGGLTADGRGIRAAQKVRLMHAAVRAHLLASGWSSEHHGPPINQGQLVGTMLAFSCVVTDALRALGFEVRDDEAEAWFHLWQVVGVLLGIDEDNLPTTLADGQRLMTELRARFWASSPEGSSLAQVTLAVMEETLPGGGQWQLPAALVRHLAGDRCADLLELPRAPWTQRLVQSGRFLLETAVPQGLTRSPLAATAQQTFFALMRALGEVNTRHDPVAFHLPDPLRRN